MYGISVVYVTLSVYTHTYLFTEIHDFHLTFPFTQQFTQENDGIVYPVGMYIYIAEAQPMFYLYS